MTDRAFLDEAAVRRLAEAAAWRVRLAEEELETCEAFEAWMADAANAGAFEQVQRPWAEVGERATSPEFMAVRAGALARARRHGRRRWTSGVGGRIAAGLAAVVLVAGGAGGWLWFDARPDVYRTALGERRVVPLSDGSKVSLDSGSEVRIRYTEDARRLELLSGQARFDVTKDVRRPFSVTARDQTVVATGTAFNVDLLGRNVLVTLIEGQVHVVREPEPASRLAIASARRAEAAPPTIVLAAGQQLVAAPAAPPVVATADLQRATAWEDGQLAFDHEPLGAVVERISRYSERPVRVAPEVAGLRMSGVFRSGDLDTFVDVVTRYLSVRARTGPEGEIVLEKQDLG